MAYEIDYSCSQLDDDEIAAMHEAQRVRIKSDRHIKPTGYSKRAVKQYAIDMTDSFIPVYDMRDR